MDHATLAQRRGNASLHRLHDHRTPSERDLARLIHCAAFRRLQAKTQVLGISEGDFHRTRLTHSMEVAQIGKGIVRNMLFRANLPQNMKDALPDNDQIFCIGLAHDLGHPPFGHGGETALNYCMREHGGFEGNGQTLRILARNEAHTPGHGLDMTRRTLMGILKYPVNYSSLRRTVLPPVGGRIIKAADWKPPKCYHDEEIEIVQWILEPLGRNDRDAFTRHSQPTDQKHGKPVEKSLDTSIMEIADDIAYGVHDLEDGIALRLVHREMWLEMIKELDREWLEQFGLLGLEKTLFNDQAQRKQAIGGLVNAFMVNVEIQARGGFEDPLLKYNAILDERTKKALTLLKSLVNANVIKIPEVQTLEFRGQQIVMRIFEALASDPERLLKRPDHVARWREADGERAQHRVICDFIAGMTDEYATRLYERLFMPRQGTVFQRL